MTYLSFFIYICATILSQMKKLLLLPVLWLFATSAVTSPELVIAYKYEVIATRPWKGYYSDEGGSVMVNNQPLYWTFEGKTTKPIHIFGVSVRLMPPYDEANSVVCKIYINDSIVRNDTFTLDQTQTEWSTHYTYVKQ